MGPAFCHTAQTPGTRLKAASCSAKRCCADFGWLWQLARRKLVVLPGRSDGYWFNKDITWPHQLGTAAPAGPMP